MNRNLNLIERIQLMLKPSEVTCDDYMKRHLVNSDPVYLKQFTIKLANGVETPLSMIAVGESIYPENYWKGNSYKTDVPSDGFRQEYDRISLIVAPESIVPMRRLRTELSAALLNMGYEFRIEEFPVNQEYGKKEVVFSTELCNSTPVELLLGSEDIITKTARFVVDYNKRHKEGFCVVYSDMAERKARKDMRY